LSFLFTFISCQKDEQIIKEEVKLTREQINQQKNLEKISQILIDIANSKQDYTDVHNAVNLSIKANLDEQYRIADILFPGKSFIPGLKSIETDCFSKKFRKALMNSNHKSSSGENLVAFILNNDVQIYWPYSEEWDGKTTPTITYYSFKNEHENIGLKKVKLLTGEIRIDTFLVNDEYAYKNPVWIVNFCDDPLPKKGNNNSYQKKGSISIHQLSVGFVKSTKHYDPLFRGGDEYKFCLIGGKITSWETAEVLENIQTINLTRKDIRKKRWKKFYYELDDDWYVDEHDKELGRKFGLIEFDKRKTTRELKFEPKVVINDISISLGSYSIKTESKEGWIKVDTYQDRDKMIRFQHYDMGHGTMDTFRVYAAGGVYWTLPIRTFD